MMQDAIDHKGLRMFSELLDIPAPSGREERLIAELDRRVRTLGYDPEVDANGNLLVRVRGRNGGPLTCLVVKRLRRDLSRCPPTGGGGRENFVNRRFDYGNGNREMV